ALGSCRWRALELVGQAADGRIEFDGVVRQRHGAAADGQTTAKGAAAGTVAAAARTSDSPVELDGIIDERHAAAGDGDGATHPIAAVSEVVGNGRKETAEAATCLLLHEGRTQARARPPAHVEGAAGSDAAGRAAAADRDVGLEDIAFQDDGAVRDVETATQAVAAVAAKAGCKVGAAPSPAGSVEFYHRVAQDEACGAAGQVQPPAKGVASCAAVADVAGTRGGEPS